MYNSKCLLFRWDNVFNKALDDVGNEKPQSDPPKSKNGRRTAILLRSAISKLEINYYC